MAYESVDARLLKRALGTMKDINANKIKNLSSSLSDSEWNSVGKGKIKIALRELSNEIDNLESTIGEYKNTANYIEKHKNEQKNLNSYNNKIKEYERKLRNCAPNDELSKETYKKLLYNYRKKAAGANSNIRNIQQQINKTIR